MSQERADALSRAPVASTWGTQAQEEEQSSFQVPSFPICQQAKTILMSARQLNRKTAPITSSYVLQAGLPDRCQLKGNLLLYWQVKGKLTLHNDLLILCQSYCCTQRPASCNSDGHQLRHPEMLTAFIFISMVARSV